MTFAQIMQPKTLHLQGKSLKVKGQSGWVEIAGFDGILIADLVGFELTICADRFDSHLVKQSHMTETPLDFVIEVGAEKFAFGGFVVGYEIGNDAQHVAGEIDIRLTSLSKEAN